MKTLVCHGDSLTEASDLEDPAIWPTLVEGRLKIKILNSGIGGDTTAGLLSRFYHDVVRHGPDHVLIMGGTNDLWWDLDLKLIQANIFTMTCQAEYHHIIPIVGLPIPINVGKAQKQDFMPPQGGYQKCVQKLAALVEHLTILAQQNEIACLDFYHLFCDDSGTVDGKYYLEDGLHPNKAGHHLMAQKTAEMLQSQFNFS